MSRLKKALTVLFAAAGIACLGGVAACNAEPDYYKLTFQGSGVDYVLRDRLEGFVSGGTVMKGVEVSFTVTVGSSAVGTPTVYLNGEKLTADANGVYTFVMNGESNVTTEGVGVMHTVSFNKFERVQNDEGDYVDEERRITYLDVNGKEIDGDLKVESGSSCSFKLKKSVYYKDEYSVLSNYDELTPDSNGVYTIDNVTANVTVNVMGLTQADSFATRDNCGKGTKEEPYLLSEPIDLYYLAALTNSDFYAGSRFYAAYYEMTKDIDMEGEQMYVVGDNSIETAVFCGEFDGKGHTVKNFYVTDEVVDQETFENAHLQYVGFFGFVAAQNTKPAVIKNLNLENAELYMHTAAAKLQGQSGGLIAGYAIGAEISGCSVNGNIIADSNDTYFSYTGGVAGIIQSAYNENVTPVLSFDSYIKDCTSTADINATGGVYAAGGIVGYTISADTSAIGYVLNCTSSGNVYGSMHAGGIAGFVGVYGSVTGCTATGSVLAVNPLLDNSINDAKYYYAYAGGIAGYAENDSVIAYCKAENAKLSATAASGTSFAVTGNLLGAAAAAGSSAADTLETVLVEGAPGTIPAEVKVNGVTYKPVPVTHWYAEDKLSEYVTGANGRSWGYYFDEQLKNKVPAGFVPVKDVTLYCGYADYSKVAGEYSVRAENSLSTGRFTLTADGFMKFRQGALSHTCRYIYDGETVTLFGCALASLVYNDNQLDGAHFSFKGKPEGGKITLTGEVSTVSYTADGSQSYSSEMMTCTAAKEIEGFGYGKYVGGGVSYVFNRDGSAQYAKGLTSVDFVYAIEGGDVTLTNQAGDAVLGKVSANRITEVNGVALEYLGESAVVDDSFAGSWFLPGMRERIEITLGSTAENGGEYGSASLYFAGGKIVKIDGAEYDVQTVDGVKYIFVYVKDKMYATLTYDGTADKLSGTCYSEHYGTSLQSTFFRYDNLNGEWNSTGEYSKFTFNGKGLYNEGAKPSSETTQALLEVKGSFTAVTAGNVSVRGSYSLGSATEGTAQLGDKLYKIVIGETQVTLTDEKTGEVITLTK